MTLNEKNILSPYIKKAEEMILVSHNCNASLKEELKEKLLSIGLDQEALAKEARNKRDGSGEGSLVIRASLEFSNVCKQKCAFCGITVLNKELSRYRMTEHEIYSVIDSVSSQGIQELHLASGEDWGFKAKALSNVITYAIDRKMSVTLVTSQRNIEDYKIWKDAGAVRYILKVETTNQTLFTDARTGTSLLTRVAHLLFLRDMGFKIGSGIICGLPNQNPDDIVNDILFFKTLQPDMASVSRFLPNYQSRYANYPEGSYDLTLNFLSLLRIELSSKGLRIPAGTTLGRRQVDAINHGANVISLHVTPEDYADLYTADMIKERTQTRMKKIYELAEEVGMPVRFLQN